jgi:ATP-dependent Clp protease adaptor protein ClpS
MSKGEKMEQLKEIIEDSIVDDSFYNVIMFNDDVTPFEYVICILNEIFNHSIEDGLSLAMHIHQNGQGIVATLPMQEAYDKVDAVDAMNSEYGFLLQTNVEKA